MLRDSETPCFSWLVASKNRLMLGISSAWMQAKAVPRFCCDFVMSLHSWYFTDQKPSPCQKWSLEPKAFHSQMKSARRLRLLAISATRPPMLYRHQAGAKMQGLPHCAEPMPEQQSHCGMHRQQ